MKPAQKSTDGYLITFANVISQLFKLNHRERDRETERERKGVRGGARREREICCTCKYTENVFVVCFDP